MKKVSNFVVRCCSPRVECFASKREQDVFYINHDVDPLFQTGNLSSPEGLADLRRQIEVAYAEQELRAELCHSRSGELLRHIGTATVVRDLEFMSSVLDGKDALV